jgi:hypothetical protein
MDEGHAAVVTVGRLGQGSSQAAVLAARAPSTAMVEGLFAAELGFSPRGTAERKRAQKSRGG